ncbi:MAG: FtsW/RodA/SpoVE family cell cycle protein [Firmicutes bacterium]|nr:FtsW/RodA/SpoVE family cell cycle protein [Bacillota bacterium]
MRTSVASLNFRSVDFPFLLITLLLTAFGLVMVFSASYYSSISIYGTPFWYLIRDGIWICLGFILMFGAIIIDYRVYKAIAPFVMIFIIAALVAVLFIGEARNGATRWLGVGPLTFMPGEWAKLAIILFIAWFMGEKPGRARSFLLGILPVLLITGGCAFLVIRQPNLSTAITICGIAVAMLLVAGMHWIYVGVTGALGVGGLLFIVFFMQDSFWYTRMTNFLNPFEDMYGEGYQVAQSLLALGSGGLSGVGLGKSVQKSLYLPEPQNDFILAIIGEELGYIGIIALLIIYCLFIWRGIHIAINAPDQYGMLLASGIVIMVAIQVILNIAVVTASMPATGINLPFISYGGNGILIFLFSAGVLLNISRQKPEPGGTTL